MKLLSPAELRLVLKKRRERAVERSRVAGWRALKSADVPQARTHARQTLRLAPLWPESWRLAYCALRGREGPLWCRLSSLHKSPVGPAVPAVSSGTSHHKIGRHSRPYVPQAGKPAPQAEQD